MPIPALFNSVWAHWGSPARHRQSSSPPPPNYERILQEPSSYWDTFHYQYPSGREDIEWHPLTPRENGMRIAQRLFQRAGTGHLNALLLDVEAQNHPVTDTLPPYTETTAPTYRQRIRLYALQHPRQAVLGMFILTALSLMMTACLNRPALNSAGNPDFLRDYADMD